LAEGPDVIDPSHIREGVCVRLENNGYNLRILKAKSFNFRVLESIEKDSGVLNLEEAS